jgi:hypothetical protein
VLRNATNSHFTPEIKLSVFTFRWLCKRQPGFYGDTKIRHFVAALAKLLRARRTLAVAAATFTKLKIIMEGVRYLHFFI